MPAPSRRYEDRVGEMLDFKVYGLILQLAFIFIREVFRLHQALYRKWRPQSFDDVYGQEHITSILKYETSNNKFSHAYLFCGSRGTGKTTCAKILAKAVNCESPENGNPCNKCASCRAIDAGSATDVLEMDAASNNGVDNIRDIRDEVVYTPSMLKYRVYIVDEVHMLTGNAFNALLKTLEEPPSHVVFILATTELHKLPSTIISRCQRFDFRRITVSDIMARLAYIAQRENIEHENDALRLIAKYAQGGMRDAISLFELCAGSQKKLTSDIVINTIGSGGNETIAKVLVAVSEKNYDVIFSTVDDIVSSSKDIVVFWNDVIAYCRDILVYKTTSTPEVYLDLTDSEKKLLGAVSERFTKETVIYYLRLLNDSLYLMQKSGVGKRSIAEMTLVKMGDLSLDTSPDAMLSRISKLEMQLAGARYTVIPSLDNDGSTIRTEMPPNKKETSEDRTGTVTVSEDKVVIEPPASKPQKAEKMLRGWRELCDRITAAEPSAAPFLKMSRAYEKNDGCIAIRFGNSFAKDMFVNCGLLSSLCSVLSGALGRQINERDIEISVAETFADEDGLDDIIQ